VLVCLVNGAPIPGVCKPCTTQIQILLDGKLDFTKLTPVCTLSGYFTLTPTPKEFYWIQFRVFNGQGKKFNACLITQNLELGGAVPVLVDKLLHKRTGRCSLFQHAAMTDICIDAFM
jgi:hypothetical protein